MRSLTLRLLALIAVLLLPFGMQPAAVATVMYHHASMPMQHCPDQGSNHTSNGTFAECTMACSAALPAADASRDETMPSSCAPAEAEVIRQLHGLHPDTATPPPKHA